MSLSHPPAPPPTPRGLSVRRDRSWCIVGVAGLLQPLLVEGWEKRPPDFPSGWSQPQLYSGWVGVEGAWGFPAILGTAAVVIKRTGSPWSRAGNLRTRKLVGLGKRIQESGPVVRRGGGHWLTAWSYRHSLRSLSLTCVTWGRKLLPSYPPPPPALGHCGCPVPCVLDAGASSPNVLWLARQRGPGDHASYVSPPPFWGLFVKAFLT